MNSNENNEITVIGTVVGTPDYSHSVGAERFLKGVIKVHRLSGQNDMLTFVVSERLAPDWTLGDGDVVKLNGQIRCHCVYDNPNHKGSMEVYIFVRNLMHDLEGIAAALIFRDEQALQTVNSVYLTGALCRPPVYRVTHFGREICDMMLAVNRAFGKSDYIPCIAWGRNAKYAEALKIGDNVVVKGRIQSREYQKKISETEVENKTAFEVSLARLDKVEI